jgi:3-isopropylmalate/(R)-2-methylmalate dehydratase small subunit
MATQSTATGSGADKLVARGRAWLFGDNIPTDQIVPSKLLFLPMAEIVKHVLEELRPEFPAQLKRGDIIVAGHHFGQSSGRAVAPKAIQAAGISCIVAESFARTFLRNCYEIGLPILECRGVSKAVSDGDMVQADLVAGRFANDTAETSLPATPCNEFLLDMLRAGGVIALMKQQPGAAL